MGKFKVSSRHNIIKLKHYFYFNSLKIKIRFLEWSQTSCYITIIFIFLLLYFLYYYIYYYYSVTYIVAILCAAFLKTTSILLLHFPRYLSIQTSSINICLKYYKYIFSDISIEHSACLSYWFFYTLKNIGTRKLLTLFQCGPEQLLPQEVLTLGPAALCKRWF